MADDPQSPAPAPLALPALPGSRPPGAQGRPRKKGLTPARERLFEQIYNLRLARRTFEEVGRQVNLSERTVRRLLESDEYREFSAHMERWHREEGRRLLAPLGVDALLQMRQLMYSGKPDLVRYHAAKALMDAFPLKGGDGEDDADDRDALAKLQEKLAERALAPQVTINIDKYLPSGDVAGDIPIARIVLPPEHEPSPPVADVVDAEVTRVDEAA